MIAAVTFVTSSSTVTFYDEEIMQLDVVTHQPRIIQKIKNGKPTILLTGAKYRTIEITFQTEHSDTASKIESLKTPTEMICYYRKIIDNSRMNVKMLKNNVSSLYYAGRKSAKDSINVTFLEILSSAVSVHRKRIGV